MSDQEPRERHEDWAEGPGQCSRCDALVWELVEEMCERCAEADAQERAAALLRIFTPAQLAFVVSATGIVVEEIGTSTLAPEATEAGEQLTRLFRRMGVLS